MAPLPRQRQARRSCPRSCLEEEGRPFRDEAPAACHQLGMTLVLFLNDAQLPTGEVHSVAVFVVVVEQRRRRRGPKEATPR